MTSIVPRETNLGGSSLASLVSRGTGPSGLDSDGWEESHVYLRNPPRMGLHHINSGGLGGKPKTKTEVTVIHPRFGGPKDRQLVTWMI